MKKLLIIFVLILFFTGSIYQLLGSGESWIFKVFTWERGISRFFKPKLSLVYKGTGGYQNDSFYEGYYLYNFSNSLNDFNLINSFLQNTHKNNQLENIFNKDVFQKYVYCFMWNNIFDSSRKLISEPDTETGVINVGLFNLNVNFYRDDYYFQDIHEWGRLNNNNVKYKFKKTGDLTIETNAYSFDFIFWVKAEDFMDKEIPDRIGKKISFFNKKIKVAEFDYSSFKGYRLYIKNHDKDIYSALQDIPIRHLEAR
jgi:hypothetical protein